MEFTLDPKWKQTYPGAAVGILALEQVTNLAENAELERRKAALEQELKRRFGGSDRAELGSLPTLRAYRSYYKRFRKSYHVQLQLESIVFKNKPIPRVAALVEAMFMAELKNQLLTAGHDLAAVMRPFGIHIASGRERYVCISGQEQALKEGDMFIADSEGIMSSIIYGPDRRTQIKPETTEVVFTVYSPPGVSPAEVESHLNDIKANVLLFAPGASVASQNVYTATKE